MNIDDNPLCPSNSRLKAQKRSHFIFHGNNMRNGCHKVINITKNYTKETNNRKQQSERILKEHFTTPD